MERERFWIMKTEEDHTEHHEYYVKEKKVINEIERRKYVLIIFKCKLNYQKEVTCLNEA